MPIACVLGISIHAPTWGATTARAIAISRRTNFNPRSHVGSDAVSCVSSDSASTFQSTLPRGERRRRCEMTVSDRNFNPRSHVGSDLVISRSASARLSNFNPRSHVGSDLASAMPRQPQNFNPRSHVGSDTSNHLHVLTREDFNPRSHVGSDVADRHESVARRDFNPRSHVGSDIAVTSQA